MPPNIFQQNVQGRRLTTDLTTDSIFLRGNISEEPNGAAENIKGRIKSAQLETLCIFSHIVDELKLKLFGNACGKITVSLLFLKNCLGRVILNLFRIKEHVGGVNDCLVVSQYFWLTFTSRKLVTLVRFFRGLPNMAHMTRRRRVIFKCNVIMTLTMAV